MPQYTNQDEPYDYFAGVSRTVEAIKGLEAGLAEFCEAVEGWIEEIERKTGDEIVADLPIADACDSYKRQEAILVAKLNRYCVMLRKEAERRGGKPPG